MANCRWSTLHPGPDNISNNDSTLHGRIGGSRRSWLVFLAGLVCFCILAACIFGKPLLLSCASLAVESNEIKLADSIYDGLKALYPADFEVLRGRGFIKTIQGNYDAALSDDDRAIALRTDDAKVYANRGFVRYKRQDDIGAIEDFSKVIALEPSMSDIYVRRGVVYAKMGKYAHAVSDYDQALKLDPSNAEAMSYRSWSQDQQDNISMEKIASGASPKLPRQQRQPPKFPDINSTVEQVPHFGIATNNKLIAIVPGVQTAPHPVAVPPAVGTVKKVPVVTEQRALPTAPQIVAPRQAKSYPQLSYSTGVRQYSNPVVAHVSVPGSADTTSPEPPSFQSSEKLIDQKPLTPDDIATWAKPTFTKSFPRGWEMRGNDHLSFGPYELSLRNGELMITTDTEICWLSGSHLFYPKTSVDAKVSLAADGNLTLSAMNREHVWKRYWWTVFDKSKQRPVTKLAFYGDECLVCILDQNDVPLWHNPDQPRVSLSSMPRDIAMRPSYTQEYHSSAGPSAQSAEQTAKANHTGTAMLIIPVGAPSLCLEAGQADSKDGMPVYPETANNSLSQKWIVDSKQPNVFAIHPASDRTLALTVINGRFADGTKVILARDRGYNTQCWQFLNIGGKYALRPLCAPSLVLDNAGGPHTQVDLLHYMPGNVNTQWTTRIVSM